MTSGQQFIIAILKIVAPIFGGWVVGKHQKQPWYMTKKDYKEEG